MSSAEGHQDGPGAGTLALSGRAEGAGLVQPGEKMELGGPSSSLQHLERGH